MSQKSTKNSKSQKVKNLEAKVSQLEGDLKFEKTCFYEAEVKTKNAEKSAERLLASMNILRESTEREAQRLERIIELLVRGEKREGNPRDKYYPFLDKDKHNF